MENSLHARCHSSDITERRSNFELLGFQYHGGENVGARLKALQRFIFGKDLCISG